MTNVLVAIANQKGGVGKTVTAVSLAHGAALLGLRVLLVDLDPQGNVADSLGVDEGNDLAPLLNGQRFERCRVPARKGLDVVRSDKETATLKNVIAGRDYREMVLVDALTVVAGYDLVLFDCAPSLDVLHRAALTAATHLIVPTRLDQFAVKGVVEILRTTAEINRRGGACTLAGIVPTFYDRTTAETQRQLENLAGAFGPQLWPMIPVDNQVRNANREGKSIWEFNGKARSVIGIEGMGGGYQAVLNRLMGLVKSTDRVRSTRSITTEKKG
jgi:chromosome partitioning protein